MPSAPSSRPASTDLAVVDAKKYTQDHEWIEIDSARQYGTVSPSSSSPSHPTDPRPAITGTVGISQYAADALGDVVFVELPTTDTHVNTGDSIGAVESVKSASDIMTPVSGTITSVNGALEENPKVINQSPEADGWICKIELADTTEVDGLMDEAAYKTFTEEQGDADH